jgi:hypothetical protein
MQLQELVNQVAAFDTATPKEKIKLLAWWLHTHGGKEFFGPADIRGCYSKLHMDEPPALATYISRLADAKDLIAEKGKYKLARFVRADLDKKHGIQASLHAAFEIDAAPGGGIPAPRLRSETCPVIEKADRQNGESDQVLAQPVNKNFGLDTIASAPEAAEELATLPRAIDPWQPGPQRSGERRLSSEIGSQTIDQQTFPVRWRKSESRHIDRPRR